MHSQIEPQIARLQTGRRPKNGSQLVRNRRVTRPLFDERIGLFSQSSDPVV